MPKEELTEQLTALAQRICVGKNKKRCVPLLWKELNGCVSIRTIRRRLPSEYRRGYKPNRTRDRIEKERMYRDTDTWNPFVGCKHDCIYCATTFQLQVRRVGFRDNCDDCKIYAPHEHPERLSRIPNGRIIFVCGDSDITFARKKFMKKVISIMREDERKDRVWFLQSKAPECFNKYLHLLPENTYLLTTLETNRDKDYDEVSKAPKPSKRYKDFLSLQWDKKIVTVEPIMDFDPKDFSNWIISIKPKGVFIGYNSHPKSVPLPEPAWDKTLGLMCSLRNAGIQVLPKEIPKVAYREFQE